MADYTIKSHDRLPSIQADLSDGPGVPAPLASAMSVRFVMRLASGGAATKVNAPAVIVDAAKGTVRYDWSAADLDTPGSYQAEWPVLYTGGLPRTYPTATYHTIDVVNDLDGM